MAAHRPRDYEQRVRALKKRLAFDFQPLRETLARGLDVLIDPEAAVLCTASIEALCDAIFQVVIKNLHDDAAVNLAPLDTKVTVYHLHVALRSHSDFAHLLAGVESAAAVLECFLDDATSRALYERHLLTTPEAKHLRPSPLAASADSLPLASIDSDEELLARHERIRSEWKKRDDDPFSDVDFAGVLKCVHPAFTLTHSASLLLGALVRELLNAVCDVCDLDRVQRRVPPELYVEDLTRPLAHVLHVGDMGRAVERMAQEALERFRLRSQQGTTLTLRCRVFVTGAAVRMAWQTLGPVARETPFATILVQMCKKCRVDVGAYVGVYRGHTVEMLATPRSLGMPTGAVVYLVRTKWWDHMRRNEARRGLLLAARVATKYGGGETSPTMDESTPSKVFAKPQRIMTKTLANKSLGAHTASASRLMGVGERRERGRSGGEDEEFFNTTNEDDDQAEQEDSLSRLLRQRREGNNNPVRVNPAMSPKRALLATMATQSAQLMDTLDEAWLGFAGISASVRTIKETLQKQLEEEAEGLGGGEALENELRIRLEQTGDLVHQTRTAHELVAQLLHGAKRLRRGLDEPIDFKG